MWYLSDLRKKRNMTQRRLASEIGISTSAVAMYETGKRTPPLVIAKKIAKCFLVSTDSIYFANEELRKNNQGA